MARGHHELSRHIGPGRRVLHERSRQTAMGQDRSWRQNRELPFAEELLAFSRLPLSKVFTDLRPARS